MVHNKTNYFNCFSASTENILLAAGFGKEHKNTVCRRFLHTLTIAEFYFAESYVFIEASKKNPGDKARLLSDEIEPNENVCVQFWYHMHGSDTGNLSIYVKTNQSETIVWRLSGDQGNRWRFGQKALNSPSLYKVSSCGYP